MATLANQSAGASPTLANQAAAKTFGAHTFDEVGTRTMDSLPEDIVTFDTPFSALNNQSAGAAPTLSNQPAS